MTGPFTPQLWLHPCIRISATFQYLAWLSSSKSNNSGHRLLKHFSITPWQVSLVTFLRRLLNMDHHLPHVNTTSGPTCESVILAVLAVLVASVWFAALLSGPAPAWENEGEDWPITEWSSTQGCGNCGGLDTKRWLKNGPNLHTWKASMLFTHSFRVLTKCLIWSPDPL